MAKVRFEVEIEESELKNWMWASGIDRILGSQFFNESDKTKWKVMAISSDFSFPKLKIRGKLRKELEEG